MLTALDHSIDENLRDIISVVGDKCGSEVEGLVAGLTCKLLEHVWTDVAAAEDKVDQMKYSVPTEDKEIICKYTGGKDSIMSSLPYPEPKILDDFGAVISAKTLVDHIIALNIPMKQFDTDANWKDDDGAYYGDFYRNWHQNIQDMKENNNIPKETRVYMLRIW